MRLQTQFAIAFVPLLALSSAGTIVLARRSAHHALVTEMESRGHAQLREIAAAAQEGFRQRKEDRLLPLLAGVLAREGGVYAMAIDQAGHVIAHTDVTKVGQRYADPITREVLASHTPTSHEITVDRQQVLDIAWPVWSSGGAGEEFVLSAGLSPAEQTRLGTLRLGVLLDRALTTERAISQRLALVLASSAAALLLIALLLVRGILHPVRRLEEATYQVTQGRYDALIPASAATELAHLAESFTRMSAALSQTTVSKQFLDRIMTHMLDPLMVLTSDGRIRMLNGAALEVLGYPRGELLDQPFSLVCRSAPDLLRDLRMIHSLRDQDVELLSKTQIGIPVLFSGSYFTEGDVRDSGFIIVVKDMRERKKLEREMIQTAKLTAVGRLASGVAHEINNPLGVILGFAESLLFDLKPDDPQSGPLREIERETLRCKNLVQDLLTFSRVSKSEHEPVDLNKAVEGALSLILAQARLGGIQVVRELAPKLPFIRGSLNQLQQIIINLANNALDAMGAEGQVTVRTASLTESGRSWVVLSVIDTGSGIPPEILPRIFEPFFTTKPVGKGTGLGLGLVHEIVQKHAGKIQVASRPGHTEFTLRFPASTEFTSS
jgi:PAS domain S-box-containing protein